LFKINALVVATAGRCKVDATAVTGARVVDDSSIELATDDPRSVNMGLSRFREVKLICAILNHLMEVELIRFRQRDIDKRRLVPLMRSLCHLVCMLASMQFFLNPRQYVATMVAVV
jgi:hypothetical protein